MKKLKCGVIGLGRLGFRHATNIAASISEATLVAVSDVYQPSVDKFLSLFPEVKGYLNYQDLLDDNDIDAIIIASPTKMHSEMLKAAIKKKKKIFCEKPISMKVEDAVEIQKLVFDEKAFVQLGFMRRFDSGYKKAKEKIESGVLGNPISILAIGRDPGCPPIEFAKSSGGLIIDMAIHDIDLCRWYFGCEATEVYAKGAVVRYPELGEIGDIDHASISIEFSNGKLAILEISRNANYGYDIRTEILCEQGAAFVGKLQDDPVTILSPNSMCNNTVPGFLDRFKAAYLNELQVFVSDVLDNKKEACVSVKDGVASMIIAAAINESLKNNSPVKLDGGKK